MKYVLFALLAVLAVLVLLLLIAVVRTLFIKAPETDKKSAVSYTKEEEAEYARKLSEMIKIPTVSARDGDSLDEFRRLHAVLEREFPNVHRVMEKTDLDGNLIFRWKGTDPSKQGILLMGHQDVVPAAETTWERDPFSGAVEGGKVHGRGAMDCKNTVMAEFQAVEELIAEGFVPERDIYLSTSVNEEISGGGAQKAVDYLLANGVRLAAVMDEGGAIAEGMMPGMSTLCAAAGVVEKGFANIKFTAKSKGGHSSTPPKNNPFHRLAKFISRVEKKKPFIVSFTEPVEVMFSYVAPYLTFPLRLVMGNLWLFKPLLKTLMPKLSSQAGAFLTCTCVFTMSGGSKAPNVIPDEAYVIANIRPGIHQNAGECVEVLRKIAAKYDVETEVIEARDASDVTDFRGGEFRYLEKCVHEVYPAYCFTPFYCTGGTDCRNYNPVSDSCIRFCPIRLDAQQIASMHAANENVSTDALAEGVKFYKYYLKNHK